MVDCPDPSDIEEFIIEKANDSKHVYESLQCTITVGIPPSIDIWEADKPYWYKGILTPPNKNGHRIHKILLLGSGTGGKSTLFKQLKTIHGYGFEDCEFTESKHVIRANCIIGLLTLCHFISRQHFM